MSDTSFTNGVTLSDGAGWAQDINNAIYRGSGLSGNTTIASATTPDIFATTTTHTITYTGTATCTGFVAAPAAGAWRVLNCSAAAVFTAGANMIIPGVGSGSNFTAAANTMILVTALTTTQFLLNIFKADGTPVVSGSLSPITASLGADVNIGSAATYVDGPSIAQGTSGTWFVSGNVTVLDTNAASYKFKLYDGTTVISSGRVIGVAANATITVSLSGYIASPAGNLRIAVSNDGNTTSKIVFNNSGNSKDSTISAIRIA